jgi:GDP/UDP-N,N'-diacetylbacillosamine 2-epimerase (hydrolysing)
MRAAAEFPELEVLTLVTGMHLIDELGMSIDLIRDDGFPVSAQVPFAPADDGDTAWARAMGPAIAGYADAYAALEPDIIVLSGDRVETFACCVAASYAGLPMAHVQAGDKSGHIDDIARMAMAKLCHIHFASCADSAERVRRLGEQEFRIHDVGAPQLDDIIERDFTADTLSLGGVDHDLSAPYVLLVQHPVMVERDDAAVQMEASVKACLDSGLPVYWVYPNSDLGFRGILQVIETWSGSDRLTVLRNLDRDDYLALLANATLLVGNSSSGILEAPSFKVSVVNVGNRQRGRPQASNIINCGYGGDDMAAAIASALGDETVRAACDAAVNPYGDGQSGGRICEILRDVPLDAALLDKQTVY